MKNASPIFFFFSLSLSLSFGEALLRTRKRKTGETGNETDMKNHSCFVGFHFFWFSLGKKKGGVCFSLSLLHFKNSFRQP